MQQTCQNSISFVRAWVENPFKIGAVLPSGRSLARLIVHEAGPQVGPVLELGAGTGVFTQALLDRGIAAEDLTVIEHDERLFSLLSSRFPDLHVMQADAARLRACRELSGMRFGAVISGLPLLSMPLRKVMLVLQGSFEYMRPAGSFYQFTYGPACPVPARILDRFGLNSRVVGRTWRNIPPAAVYAISRKIRDDQ